MHALTGRPINRHSFPDLWDSKGEVPSYAPPVLTAISHKTPRGNTFINTLEFLEKIQQYNSVRIGDNEKNQANLLI